MFVENPIDKATSFGSSPSLNDKVGLPSLLLYTYAAKPIATHATYAFADGRAHVSCAVTKREALTMIHSNT